MKRTMRHAIVILLTLVFPLGLVSLVATARPAVAEPIAVTPLPPVEDTDGRAGACFSNYYEHGNRPFLPLVHATGVRHDRVDFRWPVIEPANNQWSCEQPYDELVADELAEGVDLVAILQWTPEWAAAGGQGFGIVGSPQHPLDWYMPTLCMQASGVPPASSVGPPQRPLGWYMPTPRVQASGVSLAPSAWSSVPAGLYLPWDDPGNHWGDFVFQTVSRYSETVSVWEIWNEPDGDWGVWDGSAADYAQLLKVGYQAAKAANPNATVLFGGLMYWADPTFFERVLDILNDDPTALDNNYFFDVMSVHFYSRSSNAYDMINYVRSRMSLYVPDHPIWLTETGVPVYDGAYPGVRTEYSATEAEAAAYLIQSYANAIAADVKRYHWFRAHDGDMGEHFGLTHDENYLRPAYVAYQVATTYLVSPTFTTRVISDSDLNVTLWGTPRGKVSVLWNESPATGVYTLPAAMPTATLVNRWGVTETITATGDVYTFTLPGATANRPSPNQNDYIIGGGPLIVVETETPSEPPTSTVHSLPEITYSPAFTVTWEGQDNQSGVWGYDVQVRDGDGEWVDWWQSDSLSAQYTGQHDHIYYFRSRATDRVGNRESWPEEPQAHTTLDLSSTFHLSIGAFFADDNRNGIRDISGTLTTEITLTQVALRFLDETGQDVVSPTVGSSSWAFTTTVYAGQTYQLWATSADHKRILSFTWPLGGEVYTDTRPELGLWPITRSYLPLVLRGG